MINSTPFFSDILPIRISERLTAGLKYAVQIGPKVSINAMRTKATAIASASTAIANVELKTYKKSIIGEIAAMTRNIDPMNSQKGNAYLLIICLTIYFFSLRFMTNILLNPLFDLISCFSKSSHLFIF